MKGHKSLDCHVRVYNVMVIYQHLLNPHENELDDGKHMQICQVSPMFRKNQRKLFDL